MCYDVKVCVSLNTSVFRSQSRNKCVNMGDSELLLEEQSKK